MKMRALAVGVLCVCCLTSCSPGPDEPDPAVDPRDETASRGKLGKGDGKKALVDRLLDKSVSSKALEEVLEKPEECSSFALIVAALVAYGEGRLEDSAFLFYAGQLRASFDKVCFPPRGQGGDNPFLAIGAMCAQYGGEINSAVMKKPKVYAKAIDRLEKWNPKAPKDYDPGYKFTIRKTEKEATEAEKVHRAEYIKGMKGVATLLNDKEYFAAFKVVQAYNLSPLDNHPTEEVQKARKTMVRIEKEKGIKGFGRL